MPVEIKELVIRAVANEPTRTSTDPNDELGPRENLDALIEECTQHVLKIIERREER